MFDSIEPVKVYPGPMEQVAKQAVIDAVESRIRADAWLAIKLNPLIGTDKASSEPVWDKERNVL